ncbi:MAG: molybdate ABC transporter substrate-binding protein [Sphingomonas sp.]|nr:molybdate ABC transporter substrate-binding protein [Sphingomonas sp.]
MVRKMLAVRVFAVVLAVVLAAAPVMAAPRTGPVVLAAASLQEALSEAADRWAARGHARPVLSFAASSTLARQIAAGAPADLFVSADTEWVDDIARRGLVAAGTSATLAGNALVLIAPVQSRVRLDWRNRRAAAALLSAGPLAMADPVSVPAGRYGEAALRRLGLWAAAAPHVVRAENVRAALALVERGAAPLGIVYATDARAAKSVRIVAAFPPASHPPIRYPIVRLAASTHPGGEAFRRYLLSAAGRMILRRYGFQVP